MIENPQLGAQLRELAVDACIEVFASYNVTMSRSNTRWAERDGRVLCGVLGFLGDGVRGTCMLAGTEGPIEDSCPRGGRLRDWVGELTNQLGGKLKAKFLARGVEIALATPVVLSGIQIRPLTGSDEQPHVLQQLVDASMSSGDVMVWVEAESTSTFALGEPTPLPTRDGEVLLF